MFWVVTTTYFCVLLTKSSGKLEVSNSCQGLEDCGQPLFLTPLLEKGQIQKAQELSKVTPNILGTTSYTGFFTVNKQCESNLFFWFFPAQHNWSKAPVVLWLQGGPGGSSLFGLFREVGPLKFRAKLEKGNYSWNEQANLLFIDQPVGAGFSFTKKDCYATNETQVSADLYSALAQFFELFPNIKGNKFYITGESYAGYYIPSIGLHIHKKNLKSRLKINLKGMMIGNGYMDPQYQNNDTEYLYQIGLTNDYNGNDKPKVIESFLLENIKNKYLPELLRNTCTPGTFDWYNYLDLTCDSSTSHYSKFLERTNTRKSIHVGNQTFFDLNRKVFEKLFGETTNIKPMVEELLEHYPMVFYNGQLDTVCPYPLLVRFLRALSWRGEEDYLRAPRHKWCVDRGLVGFFKSAHNLHEVMVRDAGHMVPHNRPLWAFQLVNSVISSPPSDPLAKLSIC